jgi:hypothetical protein
VNDLRVLRDRVEAATDALGRSQGAELFASAAAIVITTVVETYPTSAGVMYAVLEQIVTGSEVEGATPTVTTASGALTFFALNLGTAIPAEGTQLVVHSTGGRWTFRYDG